MGYDILMGEVEKLFLGEMIGRFYIVQVFVKKGYFFIIKEVFEKFLGFGKFVYVKKDKLKFQEVIEVIKKVGGFVILVYFYKYLYLDEGSENVFLELKEYGFDGFEVFYLDYS